MKKLLLSLAFMMLSVVAVLGQTPLEKCQFYKAYLGSPTVKKATLTNGVLTKDLMAFLYSDSNPIDERLAVINALGTKNSANKNDFISYLFEITGMNYSNLSLTRYQEMVCCYLDAMAHYDDTDEYIFQIAYLAEEYFKKNSECDYPNTSIALVCGLIISQWENVTKPEVPKGARYINNWWGVSHSDGEGVKRDLKIGAVDAIWNSVKDMYIPTATIRIVSKSKNPFEVTIDGNYIGATDPYEVYDHICKPGYHHIEAKQKSGYTFYPTINKRDVQANNADEIYEVYIGFED